MRHSIEGYLFNLIGTIEPLRGDDDRITEETPQSRYRNRKALPLNNYGRGPFCRFRVARGCRDSGVYIIASGATALYVGECQNLEDRYGSNGYGGISPRNCFRGGQETNCRINRHFPDDIQIRGNRTTVPLPRERHPLRSHRMT